VEKARCRRSVRGSPDVLSNEAPRAKYLTELAAKPEASLSFGPWGPGPALKNRAGGIRTHGLHVPNVALYQAEPQPAEKKRRLGACRHEVNRDFQFGSIKIEALHKNRVSLQTGCSVDVAFLNHQSLLTNHLSPNSLRYAS
jgi:hypothetical protein